MKNRKAIGRSVGIWVSGMIVGICIVMLIVKINPGQEYEDRGIMLELEEEKETLKQESDTLKKEKQKYAENAYNLGKLEYLALTVMKPEDAAEFQKEIQQIITANLTLEEQEEKIDEIFQTLEEYIAGEGETSGGL